MAPNGLGVQSRVTSTRAGILLALGLGALTTLIALAISTVRPLWVDEEFTQRVVNLDWGQFTRLVLYDLDAVHALHYLVVRSTTGVFGETVFALRLPSAIFMGVACAGIVAIGLQWRSFRFAAVAGIVFATLPIVARYGTEARSMALATAMVVWATWAVSRIVLRPRIEAWAVVAYLLLLTIAAYSFLYAWLIAVAHVVAIVMSRSSRPRLTAVLLAQGVSIVLMGPLLVLAWQQQAQIAYLTTTAAKNVVQVATIHFGHGDRPTTLAMAVACWSFISWATLRRIRTPSTDPSPHSDWLLRLGWAWALAPAVVLLAVSLFKPTFTSRYVVYSAPALAILLAWSFESVRRRSVRMAVAGCYLALAVAAFGTALVNHGDG